MSETIVENLVPKAGAVSAFWETFCRAAGVPPHTPYQAWYFGDSPAMAHELVELVLNGPKRATASSGWMNETVPEAAPVPDGYSVVTEHDGTPRAVIRTVWLEVRPLAGISWAAEPESLRGPREVHPRGHVRSGHQGHEARGRGEVG